MLTLENHAKLRRNIDKLQILDVMANFMVVSTTYIMVVSTSLNHLSGA